MNKSELIDLIAESTESSKAATKEFVDALINGIKDTLKSGEEISISGLGQFLVRDRAARTVRDPSSGNPIEIPARKVPAFKPAKALKDVVQEQMVAESA